MRYLFSTFLLVLLSAPAMAAYISPALETETPAATFNAPFEGDEEGKQGFAVLARDTLFGETERRVESCAAFVQALDEGFTEITQNATPFYDDWLWVRCAALDLTRDWESATTKGVDSLPSEIVTRMPAILSEGAACADNVAAVKATLRDEPWLTFEGARRGQEGAAKWREQPLAQFDLIAASDKESTVLAVSPATDNEVRLHINGATGALERLAVADRDGDNIADMLVYLSWKSPVFGPYRQDIFWLKGVEGDAPYTLLNPARALSKVVEQCPDHLSEVIAGPAELQK